jgi:hypothetical protein
LTYSRDEGETFGSATSKTLSSNEVGSQTILLSVKDGAGAGNITNELVDFTWNDAPLSVTSTKNL